MERLVATSIVASLVFTALAAVFRGWKASRLSADRTVSLGLLTSGSLGLLGAFAPTLSLPFAFRGIGLAVSEEPAAIGFTLYFDRLSLIVLAFISIIGLVVYRYSLRYLYGDANQPRFLRCLVLTVIASQLFVLSGNLALSAASWLLMSAGLNGLLTYYRDRDGARRAAHAKRIASRLGDLCMVAALGVLLTAFGTLDLERLIVLIPSSDGSAETAVAWAAVALVLAVICHSAQVPVHSWLPDTLDAPTPVSALMHAGIINAGGYLLIRISPLLASATAALNILTVCGTATAIIGLVAMWAQTDVKKSLAWSTISQMGFMLLQCGLGAFAAAFVHLIGHGFYKANAFLRSGTLRDALEPPRPVLSPFRAAARLAVGLAIAAPIIMGTFYVLGSDPLHHPGGLVLSAVLALGLAHLMVVSRGYGEASLPVQLLGMALTAALAATGLRGADSLLGPSLGHVPELWQRGTIGLGLTVILPLLFAATGLLSASLPWLTAQGRGLPLFVHAANGFYFGTLADRTVQHLHSIRRVT